MPEFAMRNDMYRISLREGLIVIVKFVFIVLIVAYLFYDRVIFAFFFLPLFGIYFKREKSHMAAKKKEALTDGFLKALSALSTSLCAGLSFENAFREAVMDITRLYGQRAQIVIELSGICHKLSCGVRFETALSDFGDKSGIEAIKSFATVFVAAKGSGASYVTVITDCIDIMDKRQKTREEIRILIRQKQLEMNIMSIIPFGIIMYLKFSSGSFMEVLYHNVTGYVVMTTCLLLFVIALFIAERICEIGI